MEKKLNMDQIYPKARNNEIVVQSSGDETLIYDLKTNRATCLNQISALIWKQCDGKTSIDEISNKVSITLKNLVSKDVVKLALFDLHKEDLLKSYDLTEDLLKISRREIIKKVGFSSMVALPIVATIIAPTATHAQSTCPSPTGIGDGLACSNTCQCTNACCEMQMGGGGICGPDNGRTCL